MSCRLINDRVPSLPKSILVAAWPGMGYVGFRAASYLVQELNAREFASVEGIDLFPLESVIIREGLLQPPPVLQNKFYYKKSRGKAKNLVIFLGEAQTVSGKERELAEVVLDVAARAGSTTVMTFAAYATHINHTQEHGVWTASSEPALNKDLEKFGLKVMEEGNISGLNGSLLAVAQERGFRSACLLGEIPLYALQIEYPRASLAIIEKFAKYSGISVDLKNLNTLTESSARQIDTYIEQLRNVSDLPSPSPGDEPESEDDPQTVH